MDILLGNGGDLFLTENNDITLSNSVVQKIKIRLQWYLGEWRWNDELGMPYFEALLVKNPDLAYFENLVRQEIFNVDEVVEVESVKIISERVSRKGIIQFIAKTDREVIREEVNISG